MNDQKRVIRRVPLEDGHFLEVKITYQKGGYSHWTYKSEARGYFLNVTKVRESNVGGCVMREFVMFSGYKKLLLEAKRFSAKVLAEVMASEEDITKLCEATLAQGRPALPVGLVDSALGVAR